jgi:hypothetical protein
MGANQEMLDKMVDRQVEIIAQMTSVAFKIDAN